MDSILATSLQNLTFGLGQPVFGCNNLHFHFKNQYFRSMELVTGGTGMVGTHLLYLLLKKKKAVRAIHRKESNKISVKRIFELYDPIEAETLFNKIEWVEADITDIPALTKAFKGINKVYHCAAVVDFDPANYKTLKKINEEGTANVVNLCLAMKIEKLCYVSSVATLGTPPIGKPTTEETWWNPDGKNNVYAITKYGAEMEVWRGAQEGLDTVIVNPGIVFGISTNEDGSGKITKIGSRGLPFYPTGRMGIVDVQDLTQIMVRLMDSQIKNEQFIVVGSNVGFKEILAKLAILYGKKPPRKKLSKSLMYFLSGVDWLFSKLFGTKRKLPKATVHSMFSSPVYDSSKLEEVLGFEFTPVETTLQRMVKADQGQYAEKKGFPKK